MNATLVLLVLNVNGGGDAGRNGKVGVAVGKDGAVRVDASAAAREDRHRMGADRKEPVVFFGVDLKLNVGDRALGEAVVDNLNLIVLLLALLARARPRHGGGADARVLVGLDGDVEHELGPQRRRRRHSLGVHHCRARPGARVVLARVQHGANVHGVQIVALQGVDKLFHAADQAQQRAHGGLNRVGQLAAQVLAGASNAHLQNQVEDRVEVGVEKVNAALSSASAQGGEQRKKKKKKTKKKG